MRSLLIFANHSKGFIPLTTETYLHELSKYFTDVVVATDYKNYLPFRYRIFHCENLGYDFGKYFVSLKKIRPEDYDRIALVNDSNCLVGTFEKVFSWADDNQKSEKPFDVWGLTDSVEGRPNIPHDKTYHIQSHFLVFEKNALKYLPGFFKKVGFGTKFMKESTAELRDYIIEHCEIGISQYFLELGFNLGAIWSVKNMSRKGLFTGVTHLRTKDIAINLHLHMWERLIKNGYPLIKNKIMKGEWDQIIPDPKNKWKYYKYE